MLAFECTVHEVQCSTLPSTAVSPNLSRQKKFSSGQPYVASSRVKSLENLYIEGQVAKETFSPDADVEIEYCKLKTQFCLKPSQLAVEFSVALFNITSLSKHILDIASDLFIRNVNVILLTETQVLYNQEPNMQNQFENHQVVMHNHPNDRFKSLVFLKENNILPSILEYSSTLFGDLNINALRDLPFLNTMRQYGYTLLGTGPTQIMGGLLDHVYIRNNTNFFGESDTSDTVLPIIQIMMLLF